MNEEKTMQDLESIEDNLETKMYKIESQASIDRINAIGRRAERSLESIKENK